MTSYLSPNTRKRRIAFLPESDRDGAETVVDIRTPVRRGHDSEEIM
jgi:hypothetical protein